MNKTIMLLVLAAILALPATASAIESLHVTPTPQGTQTIHSNGSVHLSTNESNVTFTCDGFTGSVTFEPGGTTGTIQLTLGPNCTTSLGGTCTNHGSSSITTTALPFHLATVLNNSGGVGPGMLVTPTGGGATPEHVVTFTCHGVGGFLTIEKVLKGNGAIATITAPACNGTSNNPTIKFEVAEHGLQKHRTLKGTATKYTLRSGSEHLALEAHSDLTLSANSQLVCT